MSPRKYTEAVKQSNRKWDAANLDRLSIALPSGSRDKIKAHAQAQGESVNGFIGRAISETMERDNLPADSRQASPHAPGTPQAGALVLVGRGPVSVGRGDMRTLYIAQGTEREYYVEPAIPDDEWDTLQKAKDAGADDFDEIPF